MFVRPKIEEKMGKNSTSCLSYLLQWPRTTDHLGKVYYCGPYLGFTEIWLTKKSNLIFYFGTLTIVNQLLITLKVTSRRPLHPLSKYTLFPSYGHFSTEAYWRGWPTQWLQVELWLESPGSESFIIYIIWGSFLFSNMTKQLIELS